MLMSRNPVATVRREADGAEADPFDDATMADVAGVTDALRVGSAELEALRGRMVGLVRRVPR